MERAYGSRGQRFSVRGVFKTNNPRSTSGPVDRGYRLPRLRQRGQQTAGPVADPRGAPEVKPGLIPGAWRVAQALAV
jgi:hypothetical protein